MNHCIDCKWFDVDDGCVYPNFGLCRNPIFKEPCGGIPDETLFIYWDHEGYSAGFNVHKDFGCIGFDPTWS